MNTYKRQIKFCYYKVAQVEKVNEIEEKIKGKFNLVEWIMNLM